MSKNISCQDDHDPSALTLEQAHERIAASIEPLTCAEWLFIRQALGRVLARDVRSSIDVPAHRNSAMDGYALRGEELPAAGETRLRLAGTVLAGHPFADKIAPGHCVRIMTGAPLPEELDTVVMQEHVRVEGDAIVIGSGHKPGQNVRQAGEDIRRGGVVLQRGRRLTPADIGLLASLGITEVRVSRRLRVAFFSTGDELRSLGEPLEPGQIYDSNRYTLHAMLSRLGVDIIDMGIVPDRREAIAETLELAARDADVVVTTGGVSVGEADYIKDILARLGQVDFWKIAIKPGRPLAYGKVKQALFFGLPGNPVSAMVTFYQFLQPALHQLMGENSRKPRTLRLPTLSRLRKRPGRVEFQRGILVTDEKRGWAVQSTGNQGSHILSSMSQADCFIILPLESRGAEPGEEVTVQLFDGLV